jgi:hypothetical protein
MTTMRDVRAAHGMEFGIQYGRDEIEKKIATISAIQDLSARANLDAALASANLLRELWNNVLARIGNADRAQIMPREYEDILQITTALKERVKDQLMSRRSLLLTAAEQLLYDAREPPFGARVEAKFQDAHDDIDEAGKCLALNRNKACVCHLMLAMEVALRLLATKLGASVQAADGKWLAWLIIANNIKPRIEAMPEGFEKVSWWEVHSMLSSVGRAWRNPTMHPAKTYDNAQAQKVYDAVKGFMNDLAALI